MIQIFEIWFWATIIGLLLMFFTFEGFLFECYYLLFGRKTIAHFFLGLITILFGSSYVLLVWLIGNLIDFMNWIYAKLLISALKINKSLKSNKYDKSSEYEK